MTTNHSRQMHHYWAWNRQTNGLQFAALPNALPPTVGTGTWPDLRGAQASHQQGASHQTLHIFFVRVMCVRDCV